MAKAKQANKEVEQQEDPYEVDVLPTPDIGDRIWWYSNGDPSTTPAVGFVTVIEGPGRVTAYVLHGSKAAMTHRNLNWVGNPDKRQHKNMPHNGGFDWRFNKVPVHAYNHHRRKLKEAAQRRKAEQDAIDRERAIKLQKQKDQAAAAAASAQRLEADTGGNTEPTPAKE